MHMEQKNSYRHPSAVIRRRHSIFCRNKNCSSARQSKIRIMHGQSFFIRYIHTTQCSAPEKEKCLFFKYERKHIFEIFDSFLSTYLHFQPILETSAAEEPFSGATTAQLVCSIVGTTFLLNKSWLAREIFLWRRP